jgi:hypothetical protein
VLLPDFCEPEDLFPFDDFDSMIFIDLDYLLFKY